MTVLKIGAAGAFGYFYGGRLMQEVLPSVFGPRGPEGPMVPFVIAQAASGLIAYYLLGAVLR